MEDALYSFPANLGTDSAYFWTGLMVMALALGAMLYFLMAKGTRENYNRRMLAAMLSFFVVILGAGTSLFSYLNMKKMPTVEIYENRMVTGYGSISLDKIRNAKIETAGRSSLIDPGRFNYETRLLIIEEQSGKAHVLPEDVYDIQAILSALREAAAKGE